jgi:hypothetical protein
MSENEFVDGSSGERPVEVMCGHSVHPAASAYPLMEGQDWEKLLASIRRDMKVQEKVVFQDGVLLDGRNRLRAKELIEKETGKQVKWERQEFKPEWGNVVDWIENRNTRRNLTRDQLAVVAVDLHSIRERALADERKKKSQFGSQVTPKEATRVVTPSPGSPLDAGNVKASDEPGQGKTKSKSRNPTTAEIIATKVGQGVKRHQIESVFKIRKELGPEATEQIRRGKKKISEIKKALPKAAKPELSLKEKVARGWKGLKKQFAVADLPQVRRLLIQTVKAEQTDFDGKGGAK